MMEDPVTLELEKLTAGLCEIVSVIEEVNSSLSEVRQKKWDCDPSASSKADKCFRAINTLFISSNTFKDSYNSFIRHASDEAMVQTVKKDLPKSTGGFKSYLDTAVMRLETCCGNIQEVESQYENVLQLITDFQEGLVKQNRSTHVIEWYTFMARRTRRHPNITGGVIGFPLSALLGRLYIYLMGYHFKPAIITESGASLFPETSSLQLASLPAPAAVVQPPHLTITYQGFILLTILFGIGFCLVLRFVACRLPQINNLISSKPVVLQTAKDNLMMLLRKLPDFHQTIKDLKKAIQTMQVDSTQCGIQLENFLDKMLKMKDQVPKTKADNLIVNLGSVEHNI